MQTRRALLVVAALVAGWIAPSGAAVPTGQTIDGIRCDAAEGAVMHIHQHVAIRDHGRPIAIPDDVGRPLLGQCFYWLHTHTPDGIIHVEAPTFRSFTLGEFFDIWGQPLSQRNVAEAKPKAGEHVMVWVDGKRYTGDPRAIDLFDHLDIAIEVGPPYTKPAPFRAWDGN